MKGTSTKLPLLFIVPTQLTMAAVTLEIHVTLDFHMEYNSIVVNRYENSEHFTPGNKTVKFPLSNATAACGCRS